MVATPAELCQIVPVLGCVLHATLTSVVWGPALHVLLTDATCSVGSRVAGAGATCGAIPELPEWIMCVAHFSQREHCILHGCCTGQTALHVVPILVSMQHTTYLIQLVWDLCWGQGREVHESYLDCRVAPHHTSSLLSRMSLTPVM